MADFSGQTIPFLLSMGSIGSGSTVCRTGSMLNLGTQTGLDILGGTGEEQQVGSGGGDGAPLALTGSVHFLGGAGNGQSWKTW